MSEELQKEDISVKKPEGTSSDISSEQMDVLGEEVEETISVPSDLEAQGNAAVSQISPKKEKNKVLCGRQYTKKSDGSFEYNLKSTKKRRTIKIAIIIALCVIAVVAGIVYVMQNKQLIGVAATVNGTDISESEIASYIEEYRNNNDLSTESAWGEYLASNSSNPESARENLIKNNFAVNVLLEQEYTKRGIGVDEDYVNDTINNAKENYGGEDAFNEALTSNGYTYDSYLEEVRNYSKQYAFGKQLIEEQNDDLTEDEMEYAKNYNTQYNGAKKYNYITFPLANEDMAREFLEKAKSGDNFEDLVNEYKSADTGSDDTITSGIGSWALDQSCDDKAAEGMANLSVGDISDLLYGDEDIYIVEVTDRYDSPEEFTSIDQLKSEWVEEIENYVINEHVSSALSTWEENAMSSADLKIYPMPNNASYAIEDMSKYESSSSSSSTSDDSTYSYSDTTSTDSQSDSTSTDTSDSSSTDSSTSTSTTSGNSTSAN